MQANLVFLSHRSSLGSVYPIDTAVKRVEYRYQGFGVGGELNNKDAARESKWVRVGNTSFQFWWVTEDIRRDYDAADNDRSGA